MSGTIACLSPEESNWGIATRLVYLGYLAYDKYCKEVYIPNEEIKEEFIRAVKNSGWEKYQCINEKDWCVAGLVF